MLKARQVSERDGILDLEVVKDRVLITEEAVTVFEGIINHAVLT